MGGAAERAAARMFERFAGDVFWRMPGATIRDAPIIQFAG